MRSQLTIIAILLALIIACQAPKEKQANSEEPKEIESLETAILGTWENVSLSVIVNSTNNTDSTKMVNIPRSEWEEKLKIKPIRTTYVEDGTFTSEYRDLNDSLVNRNEGLWEVAGDSLALTSDKVTTRYWAECKNDTAVFTGYLDWDSDGLADDLYKGVQRKL